MKNNKKHTPEATKAMAIELMVSMLLTDTSASEEVLDKIMASLVSEEYAELKKETLQSLFLSALQQARAGQSELTPVSAKEVERKWSELAQRLGLNPDLHHYHTVGTPQDRPAAPVHQVRRIRLHRVALRVAAVMLPAVLAVGGYLWFGQSIADDQDVANVITAPAISFEALHTVESGSDSVRHIMLADGTEVTLNRNTTFSYNDNREAELSGEAWFKVAKDPAHPFTIHSEHLKVTVLGTEFNFQTQTEDGHSTLSLYSGVVELGYAAGTYRLDTAGREFTLDPATARTDVRSFDTSVRPQWLSSGEKLLNIMDLGTIFDRIEAAYGVTITGREAVDLSRRYNFTLDRTLSIDEVMSALEYVNGRFGYTIDGTTITLDKKQR